ncbi:MAG: non-canonical purine NTP pyrophosphatase [Lachnospiraceae bacterium]|nr:non-canonical purine NTP pyrophosphatase [Lachnospiraceae bacterium]
MKKHLIVFATGNRDKIREITEIITDPSVFVLSMKEAGVPADPEENGSSFEENAMIKVNAVAERIARQREDGSFLRDPSSGAFLPSVPEGIDPSALDVTVMSDDSGLEIDALGGEPGIYSARYLGRDLPYPEKMRQIMDRLAGVPDEQRTARFVAAVAALAPDGTRHVVRGTMEGRIGYEIRGRHGFGYDPFFYLPEYGMTSAEISPEEKNRISHRGKALRAMLEELGI